MNISDDIRKMLHSLPNVVSVGWGRQYKDKDPRGEGIVVGVVIKIPIGKLNAKEIVPRVINDMPVDVQEVGAIKEFPLLYPLAYVSRVRPIQPGFSIGHPDVTAGTLGCFCINKNGEVCLLSNSHVIANSGAAKIGDPIYQPGVYDGGKAEDKIAELFSFTEIKMEGAPEVPDNCGKAKMLKKVIDVGLRAVGSRFRIRFVAQPFRKRVVNQQAESRIKTSVQKVLATNTKEEAEKLYKVAVSILHKGTTKGLIKKNTASRQKSSIT